MADRGTPAIFIKVTPRGTARREYAGREGFWRFIRQFQEESEPSDRVRLSDDDLEIILERNLGRSLREQLGRYIAGFQSHFDWPWAFSTNSTDPHPLTKLAAISFKARVVGYGSADLRVDTGGAGALASLLGGNLDVLEMFLDAYLPTAFDHSLNGIYVPAHQLEFETTFSGDLVEAFHTSSAAARRSPLSFRETRSQWLWLVSNASLVVPVSLALAILYFAYQGLADQRREVAELRKTTLAQQEMLLKAALERPDLARKVEEAAMRKFLDEMTKEQGRKE